MNERTAQGKVVAVTGGAQGIGRAIAEKFVAADARVVIGDRDVATAEATAADLGSGTIALPLDVTDTESFQGFLAAVQKSVGPLDILVNNAGVMWVGAFDAEPDSATERMLAVNLHGVIRGVRLAAPAMRERRRGHIITVASLASHVSPPGESTYAATKHGVLGYLTGVREELRGSGVQLSAVMPGVVDTDLAVGTSSGGVKLLAPADVADAVVATATKPRFQVTVPGYVGPLVRIAGILPQRLRDIAFRQMVPDQVRAVHGSSARADYESRAVTGPADGDGPTSKD